jgi:hypothetical protein
MIDSTGGDATSRSPRSLMLIRADLAALKRGQVHGDELCEIPGVGPIAATAARDLLGDSIVKLVITKGVAVQTVTHLGRGPNPRPTGRPAVPTTDLPCRGLLSHPSRDRPPPRLGPHLSHPRRRMRPAVQNPPRPQNPPTLGLTDGTGKRALVPPDNPRHPNNNKNKAPPDGEAS